MAKTWALGLDLGLGVNVPMFNWAPSSSLRGTSRRVWWRKPELVLRGRILGT